LQQLCLRLGADHLTSQLKPGGAHELGFRFQLLQVSPALFKRRVATIYQWQKVG